MRELLFIAIIVACPLMMFFMMRGGHGHGGHAHGHGGGHDHSNGSSEPRSAADLRRERDDLERLIEERDAEEESTPAGGGWR